jgi:phage terminase large subunit
MTQITLPMHGFKPRGYQMPLWDYWQNQGGQRAVAVWHRRAGKDIISLNGTILKMVERVGLYWHVLPTYQQGRKIIWDGVDGQGNPYLSYFPQELVERQRDDLMMIKLKNGSVYQVVGGDQPDRLVGANPIGVIMSEYSLHNPECWDLIRPILVENGGWAVFIYTPRGFNHGKTLLDQAKESDHWFWQTLTVEQTFKDVNGTPTRIVSDADIEEERRSGMPDELIKQEFYVDFNAPLVGAYYGKELELAEAEGRIDNIPWDKTHPVFTSWDLGMSDAMVLWFYQVYGGYANFIDYYATNGVGLEHYAKFLANKPYVYKFHVAPHDIVVKELGTGKSRLEIARNLGINFRIAPKLSVEDGINACKMLLSRCRFDKEKCKQGIHALRHYTRNFDRRNQVWSASPLHNWASHPADAFRYAAVSMPKSLYEQERRDPIFQRSLTFKDIMEDVISRNRQRSNARKWI